VLCIEKDIYIYIYIEERGTKSGRPKYKKKHKKNAKITQKNIIIRLL
jgi:hypothetical protein